MKQSLYFTCEEQEKRFDKFVRETLDIPGKDAEEFKQGIIDMYFEECGAEVLSDTGDTFRVYDRYFDAWFSEQSDEYANFIGITSL